MVKFGGSKNKDKVYANSETEPSEDEKVNEFSMGDSEDDDINSTQ